MGTVQLNQKPQHTILIILGVVFIFVCITIGLLFFLYPFASSKERPFVHNGYPILIDGNIKENAIMEEKKRLFIPLDLVQNIVDKTIFLGFLARRGV